MKKLSFVRMAAAMFTFCWCLLACCAFAQPTQSNLAALDLSQLRQQLKAAPMEFSAAAKSSPKTIALPLPDGSQGLFRVVESPILDQAFAAQRPDLKTYAVQSVDDPAVTGRFAMSDFGLNALLLTHAGIVSIYPVDLLNPVVHKSVLGEESPQAHECPVTQEAVTDGKGDAGNAKSNAAGNGATRRTFRIAIVGTGEFYKGNGNSAAAAQTAVVNTMNGIQAIYDKDLAIRFTVLTPFIYPDFNTDPFVPAPNYDRTGAAANAVGANFAQNTYDIGHLFHDSDESQPEFEGGGVAGLGVVCSNSPAGTGFSKARGWSGSFSNVGNGWINLLAHEIGHQFGAAHTFNGTGDNCTAAISSANSYEIASGSTIMSYQGICGAGQNIPEGGGANLYFHARSLEQMLNYINAGGNCAQTAATGNTPPVINANPCGGTFTIPKSTPFTLTGSGTDANNDPIFYTWEQYNEDGAGTPTQGLIGAAAGANAAAPLFRSYPPSASASRTFPPLANIIAGTPNDFEALSSVGRTMTFRLTGRDNNANGGGMHCSDINVTVSETAGPFAVTAPNGGETWAAGANVTVTWNNAGSNAFCNNVKISLSTDGGNSYPLLLAASVANAAGTWTGALPAGVTATTSARVKVECADNTCVVFFDLSDANFSITSGCLAAASFVCPSDAVSFAQGAAGLNLGLTNGFGTNGGTHNFNVTTAAPTYQQVTGNAAGNACEQSNANNHYGIFQFSVDKTGTYTINKDGFFLMNLYQNAFTPATPCTNWLASNAMATGGGGVTAGNTITAALTACTNYFVVASDYLPVSGFTGTVTVIGPGNVKSVNTPPGGFNYTFAAVNSANNNITAVSATSNFTALAVGSYQIYGASYANGVDPNTFVGQSIAGVYGSGACVLFSTNSKPVTVTGGGGGNCTITGAGLTDIQCNNNNTSNNPADDFFTFKLNPAGTNLGGGYSVTGTTVAPTAAAYGLATTFSRPPGTIGAGNANITIQDNGTPTCQLVVTVNSPALVVTLGATNNPTNCNTADGSALIGGLTNGQQYNLSYKLNGTAANAGPLTADGNGQVTLGNLGAGVYTELFVSPSAGGGCSGGPLNFTLNNPGQPAYTVVGANPTTCGGTDGSFTLSGLTAGTVYQVGYSAGGNAVAPADFTADANGQIVVPNLGANAYTNIIASLMGCPGTPVSVTLANAAAPVYTIASSNPTTNGGMDGTITVGMALASEFYEYTYQIDGATWSGGTVSSAAGDITFTDLTAGVYTNIIITRNGCNSNPMTATLTDPPQNFFIDEDNDGFPGGTTITASVPPPGYKSAGELVDTLIDCNDINPDEFPGQIWWQDLDGDGCGDGTFYVQCAQPPKCNAAHDMIVTVGDCNDNDPNNAPVNVPEVCNGIDDNCDGQVDEGGVKATFYRDNDGDGFGNPTQKVQACPAPPGYVDNSFDCNDNSSAIKPFRDEVCNLVDDNCNGLTDEGGDTYEGNVSFQNQAQVDAFLPCWTKIQGNLTISSTQVKSLLALSNLQEVTGNVSIQSTSVESMDGLQSLTTVGGSLTIRNNTGGSQLTSLDGLEALTSVGNKLSVFYNYKLTDCCAIHDLVNAQGGVESTILILFNNNGCGSLSNLNTTCEGGSKPGSAADFNGKLLFDDASDAASPLQISPNPARQEALVMLKKNFESGTLRLFDFSGRLVLETDLEAGETNRLLNLSTLQEGIYLLQVQMDGVMASERLVIAKVED